jgi:hypothetical protein
MLQSNQRHIICTTQRGKRVSEQSFYPSSRALRCKRPLNPCLYASNLLLLPAEAGVEQVAELMGQA